MDTLMKAGADVNEALSLGIRAQNAAVVTQLLSVFAPPSLLRGMPVDRPASGLKSIIQSGGLLDC